MYSMVASLIDDDVRCFAIGKSKAWKPQAACELHTQTLNMMNSFARHLFRIIVCAASRVQLRGRFACMGY